jgi:mannose-6-phosphate isomerase-like protein (cupin superfamily)
MKTINKLIIPILLAGSINALSAAELETADSASVFTIDNCVNQFDPNNVVPTEVGYQYWFVEKTFLDGRTLKMSVVAPHSATHPPHHHHEDEFFFILEGKTEFYLNGKTVEATPYASFYCPPESEHGIRNTGDSELKYLVIKKYDLIK